MATVLSIGDIAIVHYNTSTDAFTFVFLRDVEAGTTVNFTDNGWLAAGGFRSGEGTSTYTAPTDIAAGTVITAPVGTMSFNVAGDQIIAYQGTGASPTLLYAVDFADGNTAFESDAVSSTTSALPTGLTLGVTALALPFDNSVYAGPTSGSPEGLFAALNNSANWLGSDALPVALVTNARPSIDLDSDNSTHLGRDYETTVASGGPAVPVADTDIAIDDNDDVVIFAAEIKVNGRDSEDLLTVNGSLPAGILATAYDPATGILRLLGPASHADYEAAIRHVEFSTTDAPNNLKRIQVSVFDGDDWSSEGTAFIHVSENLTAAPPGLDLDANNSSGGGADATATYTAGGPPKSVTDIDVLITDADSATIQSATITILGWARNPGDLLSVAGSLPGGITASSYNPSTGIITLSGPASLADYQTALRQVVYSNTLATPSTADRGIQVTVNDGALTSNIATMYMHVVVAPPNIAPVLDLDADDSTTPGANYLTGFTEGGPPVALADSDISIIDSDSPNLASATITLTNPQTGDVLIFDGTPPPGIVVSGSGTSVITLTSLAASASYQTAAQQIKFSNGSIDPSNITRIVEVVVNDGVSNSNTALAVVQVEAVNNSAPVIDLDPDNSGGSVRTTFRTTFTENGAPLPIADADITITDLDSTTLVSATITLANRQAGDLLTAAPALPGGIVASGYDPASGVLTLTGMATLDQYEAALRQVLYSNTSDDPVTVDRLIEVVVNDGANASNVAAALINVVAVNDTPTIHVDTPAAYFENAAGSILSPLAALTDVDDAELSQAVVRITGGTIPGDGDTLTVGGFTNGTINGITFLWDAAEHAMVLTGASSVLNYQSLLRTVGYHSTSDNPTDFNASSTRTLTWSVSDGTAVAAATTTLNILAVNDAPQATVAATASYTENAAPVVLSPASTVIDVDNITLLSGEVRIVAGAVGGDLLTVNGLQNGTFLDIAFSYDPLLRSLTFTHPSLIVDYEALLEAVAFSSTSDNPTNSGLNPTRTLSWFLFDGDAISDLQTTVLTITALADAPVNTVPGPQSVDEEATLLIAGVSVADADSPTLTTTLKVTSGTISVTSGSGVSDNGTTNVTITGTLADINTALAGLSYTGNLDFAGLDTLTVTTDDGTTPPDIDTVAITVNPLNDAPVAQDGSASGNEDTPISGTLVATDVDSPILTYRLGTQALHGTAVVSSDGSFAYTPAQDFNGTDSFTFIANDSAIDSNTATISLTVAAVNDAPVAQDGSASGTEDTPLSGTLIATDVDSPTLTYALGTQAAHGTAVVNSDGSFTYTPAQDFNGTDSFTFLANDTAVDSNAATISLSIAAVNDPPVAQDGSASGAEDTPIGGTLVATDVDSPTLTYALGTQAAHGTAVVSSDGSFAYTPAQDFSGADSFTFLANDTVADSNAATVSLSITAVNDAPVAQDGSASGAEDTPLSGTLVATDVDSPSLTYSLGTPAAKGIVVVNPDGSYTYTPNADFNGSDSFTFTANDGTADSNAATISLTINPVNDAPVNTVPGAQTVNEETALAIAGLSVADVDSLTLTTTLDVTNGTLAIVAGAARVTGFLTNSLTISGTIAEVNAALASVNYLGNPNFTGSDSLTVTTDDGTTTPDVDTVAITVAAVADAPALDLDPDNSSGAPGSGYITVFTENGAPALLADADISLTDADDENLVGATFRLINNHPGDTLVVIGTLPAGITPSLVGNELTLGGTASVAAYRAALGQIAFNNPGEAPDPGNRLILVSVDDGSATTNAFVIVQVEPVNDPPVAQDGNASGNEDTPISGTLVATDVDGATLTYALGTQAAHGIAAVNQDGTFTYTPNQDFNGTDSFTFIANDTVADSNVATVTLAIAAVNDAPVAQEGSASGSEDTPLTGTLVATDVDSESLTYRLGGQAAHGIVVVNADGTFTYTPVQDFFGTDSFTFLANDGAVDSNAATINLTIAAVNDAPVAQDGSASGNEDAAITGTLVATDIDSESLTYRLGTPAAHGTVVVNADGTFAYTPNQNFNDSDSFTFIANDAAADSNTATISLSIAAVNDAPVAHEGSGSGIEDAAITGTVVASDIDSESLTYRLGAQAAHGTVVVNPNGTYAYTPAQGFFGTDSFTFLANDGAADSNTATISLAIAGVHDAPRLDLDADNSSAPSTYFVTTFTGADVPVADADVAIVDLDSPTLASATIHLLTPGPGDLLTASGLPAGISASAYDPGTGILTLSGAASLAAYQTAIHQVAFGTTDTSLTSRIIEITVNDGTLDSNTAVATIDLEAPPEPPEPPPVTVDPHWMATRTFAAHPVGSSPIIVADFAGDHMSDLLWRNDATGSLGEWQIVNGGWARSVDLGPHPGSGWQPTAGDFNGDGTDDIFWFDPVSSDTDIWQMANGGWAASTFPGPHPAGYQVAGTGDFNGDGTDDVLWFNAQTREVDIWTIANGHWAGSVILGPAPTGFSIAATGDTNHDGSDDIIWFNAASGDVQIWEMNNGERADVVDVGRHPGGSTLVGSADFTGDGTDDILWSNPVTNDIELWKMQDSHWAGSVDIGVHPAALQMIGIGDSDGNGVTDVWWRLGTTTTVETWMLSIQ